MAKGADILKELKPLLTAFEKNLNEEVAELWVTELGNYTLDEIKRAVRFFLDSPSQKIFPRIGEFKAAAGVEKKAGERKEKELPSCPRCNGGYCSVSRLVEGRPVHYAYRCSCPSGNQYSGLPLVNPYERTKKEQCASKKAAWASGDSRAG
jgi:hypothetical protein